MHSLRTYCGNTLHAVTFRWRLPHSRLLFPLILGRE